MKIHLYIKTHNITGMKYFGKTTKSDPYSYKGSGKYWLKHIRKWGNDVSTEIYGTYNNQEECTIAALEFSQKHNIVQSNTWANLQEENGIDGAPANHIGHTFTKEQIDILSEKSKTRWTDPDYKEKLSIRQSKSWTPERKAKHSEFLKTKHWTQERKRLQSNKLTGRKVVTDKHKGKPKPVGFGEKVSRSLTGKPKSESHKRALSEAAKKRFSLSHPTKISD